MMNLKKIASLFLATAMTMSMAAVPAFAADETESGMVELNWDDSVLEALTAQGVTGDFVTFDEIAVKMFCPDVLMETELTDEDREAGYIGYYMPEDESAAVAVVYVDADGKTIEEYQADLEGMDDVTDVETGILNGIKCVTYSVPDADTANIAFATEAGNILEFTFYPMSDEGFASVAQLMILSIQPEEMAETEAE